ncbi:MAG: type III-A CRISPR-associated RAMP protein Csm5 [Armatimonadota bacterium]
MGSTTYQLTCLSPVHIGTGQQWSKFDGAYHEGRWYVVDLDKVFALGVDGDELAQAMSSRAFSWAEWLRGRRISPEQVALYSLPCAQPPGEVYIREGIKDVYLRPYIPATTLKGAIRTAIVWYLLRHDDQAKAFTRRYLLLATFSKDICQKLRAIARGNRDAEMDPNNHRKAIQQALEIENAGELESCLQVLYDVAGKDLRRARQGDRWERLGMRELGQLGGSREWLGQPIERKLLGKDPNHDLLRAVQVTDSEPVGLEQMEVGLVWTYTLRNGQLVPKREQEGEYKAFAEWLKAGTGLHTAIRIDDTLFSPQANAELGFKDAKAKAVRELHEVCNQYADALIRRQLEFARKYQMPVLRGFYARLHERRQALKGRAFLLNLGWGGGWEAKTVGDIVQELLRDEDYDDFADLRERFKLGQDPQTRKVDVRSPFPHTRLIAYRNGAPAYPLGWVLLEPAGTY